MALKKLPGILLGDREVRILIFLWKWKLVSNAALASKRFFPNAGQVRAYNRLLDMRHADLIEFRYDGKLQNFAWTLSKKGFSAIREYLPELREEGFKSENFEHDLLVTMFHLGDWLIEHPNNLHVFTEQELRRLAFHEYPAWVPRTDLHRPDGYFGFTDGDKVISVAVEIEFNRKAPVAYEGVGEFYSDLPDVHRVIWLVPNIDSAKRIQKKIKESVPTRNNIHNFVLINDFRKQGWQSPIAIGPDANKNVRQFLSTVPRRKGVESTWNATTPLLLNTRRSYVKSAVKATSSTGSQAQLPMAKHP